MIIDPKKIHDSVDEMNCIFCKNVMETYHLTPDGKINIERECNISSPMDCYVVKSEVERLTP